MKSSREKMLAAIAGKKPNHIPLPELEKPAKAKGDLVEVFSQTAVGIGSRVIRVKGYPELEETLREEFAHAKRVVSMITDLSYPHELIKKTADADPHSYKNVDLAILEGKLGVAENSAIWLTEKEMGLRVLPFICQHLVLVIRTKDIIANMHEAYEQLGAMKEGFGTFIAGPSKTADIEQSLVLGAHGPRSLTIFVI